MAGQDAITLLLEDHQEVRQLLTRYETAANDDTREDIFWNLVRELVRHEVAEEEFLWPMVKRVVPAGERLADARVAEEAEAEKMLSKLEKLDVSGAEFQTMFEQLRKDVLDHAEHEETEVFPKLRQQLDPGELETLGTKLEMAKKVAPTHPHPKTPNTAAANLALGPVAALVDRMRDAIRGR